MIAPLLLLTFGPMRILARVKVKNLAQVVYSSSLKSFIAYQQNFGAASDELLTFDQNGKPKAVYPISSPKELVGFDERGNACFRSRGASYQILKEGAISSAPFLQPEPDSVLVRGRWKLFKYGNALITFDGGNPYRVIQLGNYADVFGIDPNSGRTAVLKSSKGTLTLELYDDQRKVKAIRIPKLRDLGDGFPECSLEFIDGGHLLCVLRMPSKALASQKVPIQASLCLIDLHDKLVKALVTIQMGQGDLPVGVRNRIASSGKTVSFISGDELVFASPRVSQILS